MLNIHLRGLDLSHLALRLDPGYVQMVQTNSGICRSAAPAWTGNSHLELLLPELGCMTFILCIWHRLDQPAFDEFENSFCIFWRCTCSNHSTSSVKWIAGTLIPFVSIPAWRCIGFAFAAWHFHFAHCIVELCRYTFSNSAPYPVWSNNVAFRAGTLALELLHVEYDHNSGSSSTLTV